MTKDHFRKKGFFGLTVAELEWHDSQQAEEKLSQHQCKEAVQPRAQPGARPPTVPPARDPALRHPGARDPALS